MARKTAEAGLVRRCRILLLAYPAAYRTKRGDEILATLIEASRPGSRWPAWADAVDVLAAGLRRRARIDALIDLPAGVAASAPVALALAAGIATFAWWRVEPVSPTTYPGADALLGVFRTSGPVAYAAWIMAALAWALIPVRAARVVIGAAVAVTVALPAAPALSTVDRPPLWVLMALCGFGLLAAAGTGQLPALSRRDRMAVPLGAAAVAVSAAAVMRAWPAGGPEYYYQPTIAQVGTVAAATVAGVAAIAAVRLVRGQPAGEWLWATALLALPAGWLGPFEITGLGWTDPAAAPHFGRLAQVLFASCAALAALVWLGLGAAQHLSRRDPALMLALAARVSLGSAAGLTLITGLGGSGLGGVAGLPRPDRPPGYAMLTLAALIIAGCTALAAASASAAGQKWAGQMWLAAAGAAVAAFAVACYDNSWSAGWLATGWPDFGRTLDLVCTLALVPLALSAVAAGQALSAGQLSAGQPGAGHIGQPVPRRGRGWAYPTLVISVAWLSYATVPHLFSAGPVLLVLVACAAAAGLARQARIRAT